MMSYTIHFSGRLHDQKREVDRNLENGLIVSSLQACLCGNLCSSLQVCLPDDGEVPHVPETRGQAVSLRVVPLMHAVDSPVPCVGPVDVVTKDSKAIDGATGSIQVCGRLSTVITRSCV